jgi:hypothetical protein
MSAVEEAKRTDVHNRRTTADTDPAGILRVVFFDGDLCGGALGFFSKDRS